MLKMKQDKEYRVKPKKNLFCKFLLTNRLEYFEKKLSKKREKRLA